MYNSIAYLKCFWVPMAASMSAMQVPRAIVLAAATAAARTCANRAAVIRGRGVVIVPGNCVVAIAVALHVHALYGWMGLIAGYPGLLAV
jgi:hypothetical protein